IATYALLALCDPYWQRVRTRVGALETAHSAPSETTNWLRRWFVPPADLGDTLQRARPNQAERRSQLKQRLAKAGIYHPSAVSRYLAARVLAVLLASGTIVLLGIAGYVRMDIAVFYAWVAGGIAAVLPSLWLDRTIAKYHMMLRKSLPDFLDLMIVCLD